MYPNKIRFPFLCKSIKKPGESLLTINRGILCYIFVANFHSISAQNFDESFRLFFDIKTA